MKEKAKTVTRITKEKTYTLTREEVIAAITEYIDRKSDNDVNSELKESDKPSIVLFNTFNDEFDLDDLERLDFNLLAEITKDE